MPRYYFDIYENGVIERDGEGVELSDVGAARLEASRAIRDAVLDELVEGKLADPRSAYVEVRDKDGRVALVATYADTLGLHWPPPASPS